jgi:AbrB family looped-hinge helix DNA binding protein
MNTVVLSSRGQLVLPAKIRQLMGLQKGDRLSVSVSDDGSSATLRRALTIDEITAITSKMGRQDLPPLEDVHAYVQENWERI